MAQRGFAIYNYIWSMISLDKLNYMFCNVLLDVSF